MSSSLLLQPSSLSRSCCSPVATQLPDSLLLHIFGFLEVPALVALLATDRHWRTLARSRSLWKPACQSEWPGLMQQLEGCLDVQPDAYRCFFFKNRRSAFEARFERAISSRPSTVSSSAKSSSRESETAAAAAAAAAAAKAANAAAEARRRYLAHFFEEIILFVDIRHAVTGKSLISMAVPLTLANVRKLFKADMRLAGHYDGIDVQETFLVPGVELDLDDNEAQAFMAAVTEGEQNENMEEGVSNARFGAIAGLRFEFSLFHRKAKTMALLGQGQADLDRRLNGYGPRFVAADDETEAANNQKKVQEGRFFGEGAEFLCAVPLFAWIFASSSSSMSAVVKGGEGEAARRSRHRVTLDALAIEVHYVDTADTSVRPQDELLECLYQIVKKELVWV
ncbi:Hypothetical protein NocV09_00103830 [Nannochloropsis oceanica]